MHLVVGLGNPGRRYAATRHNAGFMTVDVLAARGQVRCERAQFGALVDQARLGEEPVLLAKPQSYMNRSGMPTVSLKGYYKVPVDQVVVVHDEIDLPFGTVRVKKGGGHGGHNGLRDLIRALGERDFVRVRVGVSRPPPGWQVADYVLSAWNEEEQGALDEVVCAAADAVESVVKHGVTAAMNTVNAVESVIRQDDPTVADTTEESN